MTGTGYTGHLGSASQEQQGERGGENGRWEPLDGSLREPAVSACHPHLNLNTRMTQPYSGRQYNTVRKPIANQNQRNYPYELSLKS